MIELLVQDLARDMVRDIVNNDYFELNEVMYDDGGSDTSDIVDISLEGLAFLEKYLLKAFRAGQIGTLDSLPYWFPIGTAVAKTNGYPFPGEVRSTFTTRHGQRRYVVEATGKDYAGMLHIFNEQQLCDPSKDGGMR